MFREGLVSAAFTHDTVPPDPRTLSLDPERRELAIRGRIETALARLARLREGQFNFNLTDVIPENVVERDISGETLDPGLNAQELLIDLARGIDEGPARLLGCPGGLLPAKSRSTTSPWRLRRLAPRRRTSRFRARAVLQGSRWSRERRRRSPT